MRKIAISDIHGCPKTLRYLLEEEVKLNKEDRLFLLGDYIDRGPDSKGVIDYIRYLLAEDYSITCLRGNHEAMMLEAFVNPSMYGLWTRNGGLATLKSFGAEQLEEIPQKYLDFLQDLKYFKEEDDFLLVHAGLNFNRHNPLIDKEALLWSRWWENDINYKWLGKRTILYGHTPQTKQEISEAYQVIGETQFLGIDAGCVFHQEPGYGQLCAFDFSNWKLYFCRNKDFS